MADKRSATRELNQDNWNSEEEPEDAGTFKVASEAVLQKRVFKSAKRRNPISATSSEDSASKAVFSNFTAFSKTPAGSAAFGFLKNISSTTEPAKNGLGNASVFKQPAVTNSPMFKVPETKIQNTEKDDEYYAKLKGLNESVSSWIKCHVDTNPFINLKPIFKDYEKYFDELDKLCVDTVDDKNKAQSNLFQGKTSTTDLTSTTKAALSSFVFKTAEGGEKNSTSTSQTTSPAHTFSFGTGFKFGGANTAPFTFANVSKPPSTEPEKGTEENDEEEPPKVEFTPVVEDGHIYTIRCKVFVKKDGKFGDRGVGNLYLKPIPNNDKLQLIVRADTNLGNLLCNFILSSGIPSQRMGKKDVMLVCLPTPDCKPPPVPILLRVKSPEDADELLKVLEKHKK